MYRIFDSFVIRYEEHINPIAIRLLQDVIENLNDEPTLRTNIESLTKDNAIIKFIKKSSMCTDSMFGQHVSLLEYPLCKAIALNNSTALNCFLTNARYLASLDSSSIKLMIKMTYRYGESDADFVSRTLDILCFATLRKYHGTDDWITASEMNEIINALRPEYKHKQRSQEV